MPAPRKPQTQPRSRGTAKRLQASEVVTGMPAAPAGDQNKSRMPPLPPLPGGQEYQRLTLELWESLWDEQQSAQLRGVQMVTAIRWIRAFDDWQVALDAVSAEPLVRGSKGQLVSNPLMSWVTSREVEMEKCERQLGVGLRNKADLGLTFGHMKLTAQQLIEMHHQQGSTTSGNQEGAAAQGAGEEEDGWTAG